MVKLGMFISDRYEIIEKVGSGGMADVYRAKCHRLNRFVAIKILKQEYSSDTKFVSKFRAEAQSVAGLSHPNLVGVYDVGEDGDLYYIVMELVEGITLKNYIERKGKLATKEALGIAVQIAQGMEAAHQHKIIHRDIKPQNVIISKEGKVKVTDFGIAKAASSNTITSNAMGSVHYISPEQARGGFSDEKSDIYSLGVTLYEMLNGSVPFSGENTVAVALAHIQEEVVPLSALDPKIPKGVDMIVQKCMMKKTEQRYPNASALIADLKRAISDPDGDFVNIAPIMDSSSPTIHIPIEEVRNGAAKTNVDTEGIDRLTKKGKSPKGASGDEIDPRLEKALVIGSIAVAAIICIIIVAIVGNMMGLWGNGGGKDPLVEVTNPPQESMPAATNSTPNADGSVEVPDLVDYTEEEATSELKAMKLFANVTYEESDRYDEGKVIRTEPEMRARVEEGGEVTLYVSTGKKRVEVPDVEGLPPEEAQDALLEMSLMVDQETEYHDTIPKDTVIRTKPASGEEVREGDRVTIYISMGQEIKKVKVPSLLGLSKNQAKKALEDVGLALGASENKYSAKYAAGTVCKQGVKKNTEVTEGTAIDVVVSLGAKPVPTQAPVHYVYKGSHTIESPIGFASDDETAVFRFVLRQDGQTKEVNSITLGYYSFPYRVDFEGFSESNGELDVYRNDVLVGTFAVSLQRVEATQ